MSAMLKIVLVVMQLGIVFGELPSVSRCSLMDEACLKSSAQAVVPALAAGLPEIGAETLDPVKIDFVKIDLAGLKLNLNDVTIKGLRKSVIDKISVDMAKKQMMVSFDGNIMLKAKYKAAGRLLILPISGDGDMIIKMKGIHTDLTFNFEMGKNADGKDIIDLKTHKFKFDVVENAHYSLTGLFGGNKALSDPMLKFMNENWKLLVQEFGQPVLEIPNKKIFESVQAFFRAVPLEDLANI